MRHTWEERVRRRAVRDARAAALRDGPNWRARFLDANDEPTAWTTERVRRLYGWSQFQRPIDRAPEAEKPAIRTREAARLLAVRTLYLAAVADEAPRWVPYAGVLKYGTGRGSAFQAWDALMEAVAGARALLDRLRAQLGPTPEVDRILRFGSE